MSKQDHAADSTHHPPTTADTPWERLADADPIRVRDPLAELLGMVPDGEPLVVSFPAVATAAGHACPAVAGAYRGTQLALDALYPDSLPVRTDVAVRVGGDPGESGIGPMASVVRHVTGAADETGFSGLDGYGGRQNLMTFEDVPGPGRSFEFTRLDENDTVRVSFDPGAALGNAGEGVPMQVLPKLVRGEASAEEREQFYEQWHGRVQRILRAEPGPQTPFTLDRVTT